MKASSPFTALALKVVGFIMIVSSLIDYIVLSISYNQQDKAWITNFISQMVDRGIIPMVGLALLFLGYWVANTAGEPPQERTSYLTLRFWALLLSSLLGLVFLLLVPVYLFNVSRLSQDAVQQINQRASAAETQITNEASLLKDESKLAELDKAINNPQLPPEQKARLQALKDQIQKLKQDPKALNQKIEEAQTQLRSNKLEAEKRAQNEVWRLGLRTGLSSLLLSLGYIAIGWTGLRDMGGAQPGRRKGR